MTKRMMRIHRRHIQTPVYTCQGRDGRTVTLAGTMHIGTETYYQDLAALVAQLEDEGAVVGYELVKHASEEEWAAATDAERAALAHLEKAGAFYRVLLQHFGWVFQSLPMQDAWQNVDITDLELIRAAGPDTIMSRRILDEPSAEDESAVFCALAGLTFRLMAYRFGMPAVRRFERRGEHGKTWEETVVGGRNTLGLSILDRSRRNIVLIWGADHLPGMVRLLQRRGFTCRRGVRWVTVGQVPGLIAAVWDLLQAMRAMWQKTKESS